MPDVIDIFSKLQYLAAPDADKRLDVVAPPEEIAALAAKMNRRLGILTSIKWMDENGMLDGDDNYGFSVEMRPTCKLFRHCFKEDEGKTTYCQHSNEYHYKLLKAKITKSSAELSMPNCFPSSYQAPDIQSDKDTGTYYLEYHCPFLGYVELLFPIIIDGVFLGAMFVGQILHEDDEEAQNIFYEFLEAHDDAYGHESSLSGEKYYSTNDKRSSIDILRDIKKAEYSEASKDEDILISCMMADRFKPRSYEEYRKLHEKSQDYVAKLIPELKNLVIEKRKQAIHSALQELSEKADAKCLELELIPKSTAGYDRVLREVFYEGMKQFGVNSIRVLGFKKDPLKISKKMELILSSNEHEWKENHIMTFDFPNLPPGQIPTHPWEPICSVELSEQKGVQKYDDTFFKLFESEILSISQKSHLIMLYPKWLVLIEAGSVDAKLDVYALLIKGFTRIITAFLSRYELRLSQYVIDKYMLTLRLYRHECAQIARAISTRNEKDYRNLVKSIQRLKADKLDDIRDFLSTVQNKNLEAICDDVDANITQIIHMSDTISILTGRITRNNLDAHEKCSEFALEHDIITKWEKAYRKNALIMKKRNTRIVINKNFRKLVIDQNTGQLIRCKERKIYQRKRLIDMVIYNLVDNALKYSHWGTNINITIGDEYTIDAGTFPVIIENYGPYIEPCPQAFEIYFRGTETTHIDGDGLGLYVVKSVSDMLGLDVFYKSVAISEYNVGLMDEYIARGKDRALAEILCAERESNRHVFDSQIINPEQHETAYGVTLATEELERDIRRPTSHITFVFQIQTHSEI